jgi:ATP-dependent Lhr-like helicase
VRSEARLSALEVEGSVLRGLFVERGVNDEQWCDRRLLARIHHYTVQRLWSEIEPVAARDFLRFLLAWQQVSDDTRLEGPDALPAVLASLEGFEGPANAWETEVLPARIAIYEPSWLDAQCLSGQRTWARLLPASRRQRTRAADHTSAGDADHLARTPPRSALAIACGPLERNAAKPSGSNRIGSPRDRWRIVFR